MSTIAGKLLDYNYGETYERFVSQVVNSSCGIEGNKLTLQQTTELLFGGLNIDIISSRRDIYDTVNSKAAWDYLQSTKIIRVPEIKQVGVLVNKNILNIDGFKTAQNYIKGSTVKTSKPEDVQTMIKLICHEFENEVCDCYYKLVKFHIDYEMIHPFQDGNGRSGRLIMYRQAQLLGIKVNIIKLSDRTNYMKYLEDYDIDGLLNLIKYKE